MLKTETKRDFSSLVSAKIEREYSIVEGAKKISTVLRLEFHEPSQNKT